MFFVSANDTKLVANVQPIITYWLLFIGYSLV